MAIVPGKDAQVKPVTFQFSCNGWHLERGRLRNPLICSLPYELQTSTKVRLTNRVSNHDHLKHTRDKGRTTWPEKGTALLSELIIPQATCHMLILHIFTFSRGWSTREAWGRERRGWDGRKMRERRSVSLQGATFCCFTANSCGLKGLLTQSQRANTNKDWLQSV